MGGPRRLLTSLSWSKAPPPSLPTIGRVNRNFFYYSKRKRLCILYPLLLIWVNSQYRRPFPSLGSAQTALVSLQIWPPPHQTQRRPALLIGGI